MAVEEDNIEKNQLREDLEVISHSAEKASDMIKRLLTLSRKEELSLIPVDVNKSLENIIKISKNSLPKSIEIKAQYFDEPAMCLADPSQIEQVLLNLFVNASHSMTLMRKENEPQGGKLTASIMPYISSIEFSERFGTLANTYFWKISIKDTGIGMDSAVKARIFEPFFTTKEREKGTGLGLSMVYSIIKQHGGVVVVDSTLGKGSVFSVYLKALMDK